MLRRAACGALQLAILPAAAEASRRPGEVRGIRELRWVWERGGSLKMMCGSDRAAQWRRLFTPSSASLGRGRSGLGCRPQRRLWDLAAFTRVGSGMACPARRYMPLRSILRGTLRCSRDASRAEPSLGAVGSRSRGLLVNALAEIFLTEMEFGFRASPGQLLCNRQYFHYYDYEVPRNS